MIQVERVKYPRTLHLPYSPGLQNDDRVQEDLSYLMAANTVVVTEKMDGENTTLYQDGSFHARSTSNLYREYQFPARDAAERLKYCYTFRGTESMRVCGELLSATHSVEYRDLIDYLYVFGVISNGVSNNWGYVSFVASLLKLPTVPVIYRGKFDTEVIHKAYVEYASKLNRESEGYVVRNYTSFPEKDFQLNVVKWVRKNHVQTDAHWSRHISYNGLEGK